MDPDQTARIVWIHAGRKPSMLVLSDAAHLFFKRKNENSLTTWRKTTSLKIRTAAINNAQEDHAQRNDDLKLHYFL
jgi:hypothetical protein